MRLERVNPSQHSVCPLVDSAYWMHSRGVKVDDLHLKIAVGLFAIYHCQSRDLPAKRAILALNAKAARLVPRRQDS